MNRINIGGQEYILVEAHIMDRLEEKCTGGAPNRPRKYCGNQEQVPAGYAGRGTQYECLKKGFGTGLCEAQRAISGGGGRARGRARARGINRQPAANQGDYT